MNILDSSSKVNQHQPTNGATFSSQTKATKISVIGVGNVATAAIQVILTKDIADELVLIGTNEAKITGEKLDLQHSASFIPHTKIKAGVNYTLTAGSDICIVTAGARQEPDENRFELLQRNVAIYKMIIPSLAKYSPNTILLIVSNPVDILTYVAWKLSGFPKNRVIGSGTNLDSSRFRFIIADRFDISAHDVQGFIVGEHGDSSVALWSTVTVGGVPFPSSMDREREIIHNAVVKSAYEVIKLKGYTSTAIGYSIADLTYSIIRNENKVHPVSVLADGFFGVCGEVFLSLPARVGRDGILGVEELTLTDAEVNGIGKSANTILEVQNQLDI